MKNLFILFTIILGVGVASAQDKKPTKEETVDYIKNTIVNSTYNRTESGASYYRDFKKNYHYQTDKHTNE